MMPAQYSRPLFAPCEAPVSSEAMGAHIFLKSPQMDTIPPVHSSGLKSDLTTCKSSVANNNEQLSPCIPAKCGLEKVANSLEHCVTKLIESSEKIALTNVSQNNSSRPTSSPFRLPAVKIPVFSGDPLEYPVWTSAFKALVDSREMDADTKLNL